MTFRSDNNMLLLVSLFLEPAVKQNRPLDRVRFYCEPTYNEEAAGKLVSARDTFIAYRDPTGHKWAKQYLESYTHYERLLKTSWFLPYVESWINEIHSILESEALDVIKDIMRDSEASQTTRLSSAKYIAEQGWQKSHQKESASDKRGRPKNSDIKKAVKQAAEVKSQEAQDAARIGLKLVKG